MHTYEFVKQQAQVYANKENTNAVVFLSIDNRWVWTTEVIMTGSPDWFDSTSKRWELVEPQPWWIVVLTVEDYHIVLKDAVKVQAPDRDTAYTVALANHKYADVWTSFGPFKDEPNEC